MNTIEVVGTGGIGLTIRSILIMKHTISQTVSMASKGGLTRQRPCISYVAAPGMHASPCDVENRVSTLL